MLIFNFVFSCYLIYNIFEIVIDLVFLRVIPKYYLFVNYLFIVLYI